MSKPQRYRYEVKVSSLQLGNILVKIGVSDQPRVVKKFLRDPVLVWDNISEYAAETLNEFFGQKSIAVFSLKITKL